MDPAPNRLRLLLISNIASWIAIAVLTFVALANRESGSADEATGETLERVRTERLDIVSEDGEPVLVLANRRRMPGAGDRRDGVSARGGRAAAPRLGHDLLQRGGG